MKRSSMVKSKKLYIYVCKNEKVVKTSQGDVKLEAFTIENVSCYDPRFANVGSKVRVVCGKKLPVGTEATIKFVKDNPYEHKKNSLTGAYYNPSVLLRLADNTETWTSGKNLINIEPENAVAGPFEYEDLQKAVVDISNKKIYASSKPFFHIEGKKAFYETANGSAKEYDVTEQKENADSIAAIIKNSNGLYTFVEMKKQFASGNVVRHVWPLLTEDAGYSEAKKLLEEFK